MELCDEPIPDTPRSMARIGIIRASLWFVVSVVQSGVGSTFRRHESSCPIAGFQHSGTPHALGRLSQFGSPRLAEISMPSHLGHPSVRNTCQSME